MVTDLQQATIADLQEKTAETHELLQREEEFERRHQAMMERRIENAIKIGQNLCYFKVTLPHGKFITFVQTEFGMSQPTAWRYMTLAEQAANHSVLNDLDVFPRNIDNIPIAVPHISSKNNEWFTPSKYVEAARGLMGGIDLDPASCQLANEIVKATEYHDISKNGLNKDWPKRVWLNPPYGYTHGRSNQDVWSSRLIDQFKNEITTEAVLLVNAAVDTVWFHRLFEFPVCLTLGRINFTTLKPIARGSTHGSAFVYFGPDEKHQDFVTIFSEFGTVVKRW